MLKKRKSDKAWWVGEKLPKILQKELVYVSYNTKDKALVEKALKIMEEEMKVLDVPLNIFKEV